MGCTGSKDVPAAKPSANKEVESAGKTEDNAQKNVDQKQQSSTTKPSTKEDSADATLKPSGDAGADTAKEQPSGDADEDATKQSSDENDATKPANEEDDKDNAAKEGESSAAASETGSTAPPIETVDGEEKLGGDSDVADENTNVWVAIRGPKTEDQDPEVHYFNTVTGETQTDKPEAYKEGTFQLPEDDAVHATLRWVQVDVDEGKKYIDTSTGQVLDEKPEAYVTPEPGSAAETVAVRIAQGFAKRLAAGPVVDTGAAEDVVGGEEPKPGSPEYKVQSVSDLRAQFQSGQAFKDSKRDSLSFKASEEIKKGTLSEKINQLQKSGVERPDDMSPPVTPASKSFREEIGSDISKGSVADKAKNFNPEFSPMKVQVVDEDRMHEMAEDLAHRKSSAAMATYWKTVEEINESVVTRKEF